MSDARAVPPETITARGVLALPGARMSVELTVPTRPVALGELLPVFRALSEAITAQAVGAAEAEGRTVSCRKGCGACCRQVVPLSEPEARQIRDLVEDLPEPRRTEVRARFAEARRRLEEAGALDKLLHPERFADGDLRPIGMEYFRVGVPCPFLEDESCSIHPDRPIACREYLVTSVPVHCASPSLETVDVVALPGKVSAAVQWIGVDPAAHRFTRWVPLVLAPEWADTHPDDLGPRPGPEWVRELFQKLTGRTIPAAPAPGASGQGGGPPGATSSGP